MVMRKTPNQLYVRNNITQGKKLIKKEEFLHYDSLFSYLQARIANEKNQHSSGR